jgi:hypothetical protein
MEASTTSKSYGDWRDSVNQSLHRIYCITIADAGIEEQFLINYWQSNETPVEFVAWFGNKFDLDPMPTLVRA